MPKKVEDEVGQTFEVEVDQLSRGGFGVGRLPSGKVVFVPFSAPGDSIKIEVTRSKKSFAHAKIVEVLKPSPYRVSPKCPVFGECGGCTFQHVEYGEQVRQKAEYSLNTLKKVQDDFEYLGVESAPNSFFYRNRVQVHYSQGKYFFNRRESHEKIEIQSCPIAEEKINTFLQEGGLRDQVTGRYEVGLGKNGEVYFMSDKGHRESSTFSQVNSEMNEKLLSHAKSLLEELAPRRVFELFCGTGNFTSVIAESKVTETILSTDLDNMAIIEARNELTDPRVRFEAETADKAFSLLDFIPDLVFLDPPRQGLDVRTRKQLIKLRPEHVIYVSCDPMTLSRDLTELSESGLIIQSLKFFDMFPQTDHIETMVYLKSGALR